MPTEMHLQMAEALRLARPMIESGREKYICRTLFIISRQYPLLKSAVAWVKVWIADMLYPYGTYEQWVRETVCDYYSFPGVARLARLAWIDWMIAELGKE